MLIGYQIFPVDGDTEDSFYSAGKRIVLTVIANADAKLLWTRTNRLATGPKGMRRRQIPFLRPGRRRCVPYAMIH